MFKQYGFNLKKSNELGLVRPSRDLRHEQCLARSYPKALPQATDARQAPCRYHDLLLYVMGL